MDTLFWALSNFVRWVRLKIYQYEVTFAIYMLTPTEKFIFSMLCLSLINRCTKRLREIWGILYANYFGIESDSLLLSFVTMIATGIYVYLPDHLRSIYGRLYYYWAGERTFISPRLTSISSVFSDTATQCLKVVYETAKNTATVTTQPLAEL